MSDIEKSVYRITPVAFGWLLLIIVLNEFYIYWFIKELVYAIEWTAALFWVTWALSRLPKRNYIWFLQVPLLAKALWALTDGVWITVLKITLFNSLPIPKDGSPRSFQVERMIYDGTYEIGIAGHWIVLWCVFLMCVTAILGKKCGWKFEIPGFVKFLLGK